MASLKQHLLGKLLDSASCGAYSGSPRRHRKRDRILNLKARAASGDQQAIAKLQRMRQQLDQSVATTASPDSKFSTFGPASLNAPPVAAVTPYGYPYQTQPTYPSSAYPSDYNQYPYNYGYPNPVPLTSSTFGPNPQPTVDVFVGEEERAMAQEGGACERAALRRRTGVSGPSFVGAAIPNNVYRATIVKHAIKSAGGKTPTTKDFFLAKAKVDKVIGKAGISLYLPGAKPGRRTI